MGLLDKAKSLLDKVQSQATTLHADLIHPHQQQQQSQQQTTIPVPPPSHPDPSPYNSKARLIWPPKLQSLQMLGEVKDTNGRNIPRDFGRSITLGGHHFYMFGDTFCFDDQREFVGLTSNTCAYVGDLRRPGECSYWTQSPLVPEFIPFTPSDEDYNRRKKAEGKGCRIANWAFGGVIEYPENSGHGFLLNDRTQILDGGSMEMELVRVELVQEHGNVSLRAEKLLGASPFGPKDPRFGCIDIFTSSPDNYIYLLGGTTDPSGWPRNVLARLPRGTDPSQRSNYEYHHQSRGWSRSYDDDPSALTDVVSGQGHGMMFYGGSNAPVGKPFLWIGVDKWMSSKLFLGAAERPEGPWEMCEVGEVPRWLGEGSKVRYCLYVHLWGSRVDKGELLVSWSDNGQMGGLVVTGRMRLEIEVGVEGA